MTSENQGSCKEWISSSDKDWWAKDEAIYQFGPFESDDRTIFITKDVDRILSIVIVGPASTPIELNAPCPEPEDPKGLFVDVTWRDKKATLFLKGKAVCEWPSATPPNNPAGTNAANCFRWAVAFEINVVHLYNEMQAVVSKRPIDAGLQFQVLLPWAVNQALATELYLKSLRILTKGAMTRGHDLLQLFVSLPTAAQNEVNNEYEAFVSRVDPGLIPRIIPRLYAHELLRQRNSFVSTRYGFEPVYWRQAMSLVPLCFFPRKALLRRKPEWEGIAQGLTSEILPPVSAPKSPTS